MEKTVVGRFAPSPTGRMHLGNIFAAMLSWLSARSAGGRWILRHEDLDPQRSSPGYARLIEDDLRWLGLDWDEGGLDGVGPAAPYCQSQRKDIYEDALSRLRQTGLLYQCRCTRADLRSAAGAPHASDGHPLYSGRCRPASFPASWPPDAAGASARLYAADTVIEFTDRLFGPRSGNPARDCGDFVVRRADGAWAYQLAVVVDDAAMGVTEVVRGCDLLPSVIPQLYLQRLLGLPAPEYAHIPLLVNDEGMRLSKRDNSLSMAVMRERHTPCEILGTLAWLAGLQPAPEPRSAAALVPFMSWDKITRRETLPASLPK